MAQNQIAITSGITTHEDVLIGMNANFSDSETRISGIESVTGTFSITGHGHSLSDLSQDGATDGQAPVWNNTSGAWIPSTVAAQGNGGGGTSLSGVTTGTTQEEMFVDGINQSRIDVTTGTSLTFSALVVGRRTDGGATGSAGYEIKGLIKNDGGTTSFVGTPTKYVLGEDADWDATVSGDNTNNALAFLVSGEAGADVEWRATVNKIEFTE